MRVTSLCNRRRGKKTKKIDFIAKYGIEAHKRRLAHIRKYNKANKMDFLPKAREYKKNNKAAIAVQRKGYIRDHKEELAEYQKLYRQTPEGIAAHNRGQAKRERNLESLPLNTYFDSCEGHHITHNFIIYIPKGLHKTIYHNINTGQGMEIINDLALEFLLDGF